MQLSDFDYDLPQALIAQKPLPGRTDSRLLAVTQAGLAHRQFVHLRDYLRPNDMLVLNDTKVVPARFFAQKDSGGQAEVLLERVLPGVSETGPENSEEALCQVRVSKPLRPGQTLRCQGEVITALGREGSFYRLRFPGSVFAFLNRRGELPLPPYIQREAVSEEDVERYQTVFAENPGAVAAPTAGLHFSEKFLAEVQSQAVNVSKITLHVGAGTFQPVRQEDLSQHQMHEEYFHVGSTSRDAIMASKEQGGRIIAVGTTVLRALESGVQDGELRPGEGSTRLFIKPGYRFQVVDALVTNFHLPRSTLMMLVCALGGHERMMAAYRCAVAEGYRFFSYGDAMFIEGDQGV